ncbi:MAG: hypothetical protein EZS28_034157 [Streblomastix strix]|uniref:Uncharacterized protein n=1 Tax=Streblomastix strix TaxID=222440 RepID=A0A5J4UHY8_9EUKA|nr:MAG: hypothetical protein EZS28_034157 [Streblomastix strix]
MKFVLAPEPEVLNHCLLTSHRRGRQNDYDGCVPNILLRTLRTQLIEDQPLEKGRRILNQQQLFALSDCLQLIEVIRLTIPQITFTIEWPLRKTKKKGIKYDKTGLTTGDSVEKIDEVLFQKRKVGEKRSSKRISPQIKDYSFVDFKFLACPVYVFNNVSSRFITTNYVAAECLNEYTCFPFRRITSKNFFNLNEIWPLLAGIVMSSFHHYAPYLLNLMDRPCLLSILFNQTKNAALGHTV